VLQLDPVADACLLGEFEEHVEACGPRPTKVGARAAPVCAGQAASASSMAWMRLLGRMSVRWVHPATGR
jgi:hypothetical protein